MNCEMEMLIMNLIVDAGSCRSCAMDAIRHAKDGNIMEAEESLKYADTKMALAHNAQTALIQDEAKGGRTEINLFMIHAQDHIMTAILAKDLAREFVDLYRTIEKEKS